MPDGPSISRHRARGRTIRTPARDFRLLVAIDVVRGYPDRVARRPARFTMPAGKSVDEVKGEMQCVLASELASRKIILYPQRRLALDIDAEGSARPQRDFEMAYNPNDCAELRWAAPDGSEEAATCKRRAPQAQRAKMSSDYRAWFRERHWPTARG